MLRRIAALSALVLAAAAPLQAQAYVYPALQPSRIAEREYNFALADMGDGFGTGLIFQWREGLGNPKLQFTLDAGFADPDAPNADARLLIGGGLAYQLTSATTVNGAPVTIKVVNGKVMINNATVTSADVQASNGVIHMIDTVILPPL